MLLGKVDPSGHLPFTWYANESQLPPITDYDDPAHRRQPRAYVHVLHRAPSYPFGYGGSYTKFGYSPLHLGAHAVDAEGTITATTTVTNTGSRAGTVVPQLYATTPFATIGRSGRPSG